MSLNQVSFDIATLLGANGFGTIATDIFMIEFQDDIDGSIDSQVVVVDNEGSGSPLKDLYEQPEFQILVRGNKTEGTLIASAKARSIHEFLIAWPNATVNGNDYLGVEPMGSGPVFLGRDDSDRPVFSSNYFTHRDP